MLTQQVKVLLSSEWKPLFKTWTSYFTVEWETLAVGNVGGGKRWRWKTLANLVNYTSIRQGLTLQNFVLRVNLNIARDSEGNCSITAILTFAGMQAPHQQ